MIFNTYVAMDITCSEIRVLSIQRNKIQKWGSTPVPEGLVKDGVILDPKSVSVLIDTLFKSLKIPRGRVICTVTGLPFLYRTIGMPGKEVAVPAEAIERTARKEMSLVGEDMNLFWQSIGSQPEASDTNYFVIGVPKISFQPLLDTLNGAKIKPYIVGLKPLALARAAALDNVCVASLEKNYFDIVLVANGLVRVIHSISPSLQADDQAGILNEFVDAFNKAVKSFNRDFPETPFAADTPILLSGEFSSNPELPGLILEATGHPADLLEPAMELPPEVPPITYGAAVGLLLKELHPKIGITQYQDINVNLLNTKIRQSKFGQPLAYAGVAVAIIVLAGLAAQMYNMKSNAADEVVTLKQQAAAGTVKLTAAQKANKDLLALKQTASENLQKVQAELASVKGDTQQVVSYKVDYATRILSITQALPVGADYNKMAINATNIQIVGYARTPLDTVTFADNLEKEKFFPRARVTKISPSVWPLGITFEVNIPK